MARGGQPRTSRAAPLNAEFARLADPALGVLLRVTSFSAGHPAICYEMRRLSPGAPPAEVFAVPPGARRAGPLDGIVPPSPLEAAKGAAGLGLVGAAALAGWLQKRPRSGEDR